MHCGRGDSGRSLSSLPLCKRRENNGASHHTREAPFCIIRLFSELHLPRKMLLRELHDHPRQQQQRNQVRVLISPLNGVRNVPEQPQIERCAENRHERVNHEERADDLVAPKQKLHKA